MKKYDKYDLIIFATIGLGFSTCISTINILFVILIVAVICLFGMVRDSF